LPESKQKSLTISSKKAKECLTNKFEKLEEVDLKNTKVDRRSLNRLTPITVNNGDKMLIANIQEGSISGLTLLDNGEVLDLEEGKVGIHYDAANNAIHLWVKE